MLIGIPHSTLQKRALAIMPLQASDSDDGLDLEGSRVTSEYIQALPLSIQFADLFTSVMRQGVEDELTDEGSSGDSDAMIASSASRAQVKGNSVTKAKGGASFASTARIGRQTRDANGEKRNVSIVSLADVEDDCEESNDESSSEDSELPDLSVFKPVNQPRARRGNPKKTSGFSTNDNVDNAQPAHLPKKRGRTHKMPKADPEGEDDGPSEKPSAKRRGRPAGISSATKSSPVSRLVSRGRGRQNTSHKLVAADETGQRRSARASAAAAEAQAKAAAEDKVSLRLLIIIHRYWC